MPFELTHVLVSRTLTLQKRADGEFQFFTVSSEGRFPVLFAGRVIRRASATFSYKMRVAPVEPVDGPGGGGTEPLHGGIETENKTIPLTFRIFTPDGREFTGNQITRADLDKHRDLRGAPSGDWSYKLHGESEHLFIDEDSSITNAKGVVGITLIEPVPNESAAQLIADKPILPTGQSFTFDLFRVGRFIAEISLPPLMPWRGTMRLLDSDGRQVATTTRDRLTFDVGLAALRRPRAASGSLLDTFRVPKWTLEVSPKGGAVLGNPRISATVIGSGRIRIPTLKERIDKLLGPRGTFIRLFGQNAGGEALGRLEILDVVSAETIEMHDLLDGFVKDAGGDIEAHKVYTIESKSEELAGGLKLDVSTLKVDTIDVDIGPGVKLGAAVPAIRLTVAVSGAARVKFKGQTLATGRMRNGRVAIEVGMTVTPDGTPRIVTDIPDSPFDIDISTAVKAALVATLGIGGLIAGMGITEYVESQINGAIVAQARRLFANPTIGPRIMMTIFGAHLTYKPIRIDGDAIVFDHIAPVEPEPRPSRAYHGAIGRGFNLLGPQAIGFVPPVLGDTWRADNLAHKIDHVVVVMMENRSYDHVLGYRSLPPIGEAAEGLTEPMIQAIEAAAGGPFDVRDLQLAGFAANAAGRKTRLPKGVGHEVEDVAEQLGARTAGPPGKPQINSPNGFVENFKKRLKGDAEGCVPDDALGFYGADNLPFFAYLAEHYAYSDRYFCSHPGPTLPNRMYSLTGDVQHDRYGFPILANNNSDNFLLSRAQTIYDFLVRKGLGFRVYESEPSVTMLRMFARYATDRVNIVPYDRLKQDVARGDLPAFTAIEPAMHHHPQNDDHPDADMHRGQIFLRDVYDTLRSNRALWERTLLIITYDEHGGLYDHVVPPPADVYQPRKDPVLEPIPVGTIGPAPATPLTPAPLTPAVPIGPATPRRPPIAGGGLPPIVSATPAAGGIGGPVVRPLPDVPDIDLVPDPLAVPYGVRVPTFVVSPWVARGKGPSIVLDHCSILKTVLARFMGQDKPFLSDRVNASQSFDAFLTEAAPRMDVPAFTGTLADLPPDVRRAPSDTTRIVTAPLSRQQMREGPVGFHELTGRWARQLGR